MLYWYATGMEITLRRRANNAPDAASARPPREIKPAMTPLAPVQALWIGPRLSLMERLSIASFLAHGHPVHLYLYDACENVPPGTTLCAAAAILPRDRVFTYRAGFGAGVPAGFANVFRYALLNQMGGWWVDLDVVAVQPFAFDAPMVIGAVNTGGRVSIGAGVIWSGAGTPFILECVRRSTLVDPKTMRWGETGPRLVSEVVDTLGLRSNVVPPEVFYPVHSDDVLQLVRPGHLALGERTVAVHLWAQLWRHFGLDPNGRYPADSPYEQFIRQYLPGEAHLPRRRVSVTGQWIRTLPTRVWHWSTVQIQRQRRRRQQR